MNLTILADALDKLQSEKNEGRGVSCVRTIVSYLCAGMLDQAKAVCRNESDKISNYPDIQELLKTELLDR